MNFPECLIEPGNVDALFKKLENLVDDIKNGVNNNNNLSQYIRENFNIALKQKDMKKYINNTLATELNILKEK